MNSDQLSVRVLNCFLNMDNVDPSKSVYDTNPWKVNEGGDWRETQKLRMAMVPNPKKVAMFSKDDLLVLPNFGARSLDEIRGWLAIHGLSLRGDEKKLATPIFDQFDPAATRGARKQAMRSHASMSVDADAGEHVRRSGVGYEGLEAALDKLHRELPGWWWNILDHGDTSCATIGPRSNGPDANLRDLNEFCDGLYEEVGRPSTVTEALLNAIEMAKAAKARATVIMQTIPERKIEGKFGV